MSDDLEEAARERAEALRERRHERTDPEGRVRRVREQGDPPEDPSLPAVGAGGPDLPAPLAEDAAEVRKKLTYGLEQEFGLEMDPEGDYWPLVVHLGVERLKGMWLEEVRRTLEETDRLAPDDGD